MNPHDPMKAGSPEKGKEPKSLEEANENIRKAEDDEPTPAADERRAGHKPAFDRDR